MVTDFVRNRLVLFGGFNTAYLGDTWEWDGATAKWAKVSDVSVSPPKRQQTGRRH